MSNLMCDMKELLKYEVCERHSFFQMKYFIINKEPTVQAKMWQCLREIKTRYESLEALELELEECKDNLELIELDINNITSVLSKKSDKFTASKKRRIEILLQKTKRKKIAAEKNIVNLQNKKKYLEEESGFFVMLFKSMEKVEPLKNFDDLDVQKQYWNEKLLQKINLKMLMQSNIDIELIETILALPDDIPIKKQTLTNLNNRHEQLAEMQNQAEKMLLKQENNGNSNINS